MGSIVAVDIGGTQIRAASFIDGEKSARRIARTSTYADGAPVIDRIVALMESVWPGEGAAAMGVASPGPLDPETGMILSTPNIPEWKDFPLGPRLSEHFGVPAYVDNDANLAGLAEWKYGAGQGHEAVLYLAISTGIGSAILTNGMLLHGVHGLAGECGHMVLDPNGPLCGCGKPGHVESYASGTAIEAFVRTQLQAGTESELARATAHSAREIAEAALRGDPLACRAFTRAGEYLGMAIANLLCVLDPSIVILGGGVAAAGELLMEPLRRSLEERVLHPRYLDGLKITRNALGDDAGLLGALEHARSKTRHTEQRTATERLAKQATRRQGQPDE
jgi:glucokinase